VCVYVCVCVCVCACISILNILLFLKCFILFQVEDEFCYINMEGYMEKLPTNKKKATLLKTWKRRYFKTKEGKLYYFEVTIKIYLE